MVFAQPTGRGPDNVAQVVPARQTLARAHSTRRRPFENLDMSLSISDLGEHISNRDIHARADGDVSQRSQGAERHAIGF